MKFGAATLVTLLAFSAFAGARVVVPQLPPSPYDDTEISTNVMFSAGEEDALIFSLSISIDATPTNTLQIAFGRDENSDGILDWQETEFLLGWKCGVWFFRDKTTETEMIAAKESGLPISSRAILFALIAWHSAVVPMAAWSSAGEPS